MAQDWLCSDCSKLSDTIPSLDASTISSNIPHRFLNKEVRICVESQYFLPVDTVILLSKNNSIEISRDPKAFGDVYFRLWNPDVEQTSPNTEVFIDGHPVMSDAKGKVSLFIPLPQQKTSYPISSSSITLVDTCMILPCGVDDQIKFK